MRSLGYDHAPPVKHEQGWRDRITGFHSNDVESENAKFKGWVRARYSKLSISFRNVNDADAEIAQVEPLDLYEYCYYVNAGDDMTSIMRSQLPLGQPCPSYKVRSADYRS